MNEQMMAAWMEVASPAKEHEYLKRLQREWKARTKFSGMAIDGFGRIRDGDVFLFNHFARFETFIPQYFVHRESGARCRSVGRIWPSPPSRRSPIPTTSSTRIGKPASKVRNCGT